jgi:hypothetical protein
MSASVRISASVLVVDEKSKSRSRDSGARLDKPGNLADDLNKVDPQDAFELYQPGSYANQGPIAEQAAKLTLRLRLFLSDF